MRLVVLADIHMNLPFLWAKRTRQFIDVLDEVGRRKDIDGVLICGDVSDHGLKFQLHRFASCLSSFASTSHKHIAFVLGNHDLRYYLNNRHVLDILNDVRFFTGKQKTSTMYHEVIMQDVVFLCLNSEDCIKTDTYLSKQQMQWLKERLQVHEKKPYVCVLCHHPLSNTHEGSRHYGLGKQDEEVKQVLKNYTNVIWISGHIHNDPCTIKPCLNTYGIQLDVPSFQLTRGKKKQKGCGLVIDFQPHKVDVSVYDFFHQKEISSFHLNVITKQIQSSSL